VPRLQNLIGKKFGKLTVIDRTSDKIFSNGERITSWKVQCECGKITDIYGVYLRLGKRISCGCTKPDRLNLKMIGRKFGRLTIKSRAKDKNNKSYWKCLCVCGNESIVLGVSLLKGATKSCGCLFKERILETGLAEKHKAYSLIKIHSKRGSRVLSFDLTFDQFVKLSENDCHYCGSAPSRINKTNGYNGSWTSNGIDRVDNNCGYTLKNCVSCCWPCNRSKGDDMKFEFIEHAKRIVEHQSKIKVIT
jgi:hypothetical protein